MRAYWMTAVLAAALALAACGQPQPGEPEEQPMPPVDDGEDPEEDPIDEEALLDESAMTGAEQQAAFAQLAEENLAKAAAFLADNAKKEGVTVTDSGLQYTVLTEGPKDGAVPVSTDIVVFEYAFTNSDGVEIDSSRARGAAATIPISALNSEMPGLTEGLQLMSAGDRYRFFIPPSLAYADRLPPGGPLGPNEAVIFDVELIKVQNPERNLEAANEFLSKNANKDGIKSTDSGLQYEVITEGPADGKSPSATDMVKVHYLGTLTNGTEFDSSYRRGSPAEFPLNGVIAGWTEGVQLMSEGDKFRFFIPPKLAYGERGTPGGPIGPNEALIFEVELIEVK